MTVLLLGDINYDGYLASISRALKKRDHSRCSVLTFNFLNKGYYSTDAFEQVFNIRYSSRLPKLLRGPLKLLGALRTIRTIPRDSFDLININYLNSSLADLLIYCALFSRMKKAAVVVTYYGADLNELAKIPRFRWIQKLILRKVDIVQVLQEDMRKTFESIFGTGHRLRMARFGLPIEVPTDPQQLKKAAQTIGAKLGIAPHEAVIVGGYSSAAHNYNQYLLEEYLALSAEQRRNTVLVFPMTYGDIEYREKIIDLVRSLELDTGRVTVLSDFLRIEDLVGFRARTDIQIQFAANDGFAAAIREALIAGAILIARRGLPYQELDQIGVHFYWAEKKRGELTPLLSKLLSDLAEEKKKCLSNGAKVLSYFGWDNAIEGWIRIYSEALESSKIRLK